MIQVLAAAMLMTTSAPASAEPSRASVLEACVSAAGANGDAAACIGTFSRPCQDQPDGASTPGMTACFEAEARDWSALMRQALQAAAASEYFEPAAKRALARSQADWARGMERSLAVYDGRDGTVWPVVRATMQADWTARRYLWIRGLIED